MNAELHARKVIAEMVSGDLVGMDEQGNMRGFATPIQLLQWVRRRDADAARRGTSTATMIEWRDMPDGFVPPEV